MAKTVAAYDASICIMHNAKHPLSGDIWQPIQSFLASSVKLALDAGIDRDKICLDGGVGFAKDREQNWELVNGYDKLAGLGFPLLLGTSRKRMFEGDVADRLAPTVETTRQAAKKGILFVRVHDVKENAQAIEEIYNGQNRN